MGELSRASILDQLVAHVQGPVTGQRADEDSPPPPPPARALAIVTCMDARIEPLRAFGLRIGDAHVLRNAGGRVTDDVLRSLAVSTSVLGVRWVAVVHHTDCGMAQPEEDLRRRLDGARRDPAVPLPALLTIEDPRASLREDVERVRTSPLLPALEVTGLLYDIASGTAEVVAPPGRTS